MKRAAIVLGLIVAFAAGDLVGPTGPAAAQSSDIGRIARELGTIASELRLLRREAQSVARRCNDPIGGI